MHHLLCWCCWRFLLLLRIKTIIALSTIECQDLLHCSGDFFVAFHHVETISFASVFLPLFVSYVVRSKLNHGLFTACVLVHVHGLFRGNGPMGLQFPIYNKNNYFLQGFLV